MTWKKLLFCVIAGLALGWICVSAHSAMTHSVDSRPNNLWFSGSYTKDTGWLWAKEVETILEAWTIAAEEDDIITFPTNGLTIDNNTDNVLEINENSDELKLTFGSNTVAMSSSDVTAFNFGTIVPEADQLLLDPTATATATEGTVYYDSDDDTLKYRNASAWISLSAGTGDNTLDNAYDQGGAGAGKAVTVDSGAIALTATNAANNTVLSLVQEDTAAASTLVITGSQATANAISIDIDAQTTGRDIEGTGASFYVEGDGSIVGVDLDITGAGGITLQNDETILNDTDNEIQFGGATEDVSFGFGTSNTLTITSDTEVDKINWGSLDEWSGLSDMTFTAGAAATLTLAADGAADDLTIQVTGTQNSSLILTSAGTAADAIRMNASDGGLDLDAADGIAIDVAGASGEDIVVTNSGGSIKLDATEAAGDALVFDASNAAGGIDIDAGTGGIAVDITGAADFRADSSAGSIVLVGAKAAADAITIDAENAAGGIDIDYGTGDMVITGTGASADFTLDADLISIDGTGASNIQFTNGAGEDVTIGTLGAADHSLIVSATGTGDDALQITTSAGGIDITNGGAAGGTEDLDITSTSAALMLTSGEDVAASMSLQSGGGMDIDAVDDINILLTAGSADEDILMATTGATDNHIKITSTGTDEPATTETDGAIQLYATSGGIGLYSTAGAADAVRIETNGGASDTLVIQSVQGTSVTEDAAAIQVWAQAGGIQIQSDANLDDALVLRADGGTTSEITIHNDQGNTADSIEILSDDGGITIDAGADDQIILAPGSTGVDLSTGMLTNYMREVVDDTDNETLNANQSGAVCTNQGDANTQIYTLPTAAAGLQFTFVDVESAAGADLCILAAAGDKINHGTAAEYYNCYTDSAGQSVTLVAVDATDWEIVAEKGTWVNDGNTLDD